MFDNKHLYLSDGEEENQFIMNNEYMFLYGQKSLKYFDLREDLTESNLQDIGFELDKDGSACIR
jgi:hypothetical protein